MAEYIGQLTTGQLVEISSDFDYMRATENFIGLKLFPLTKTENLKLAMANLMEGADIPVMAFVHALDTEARIGDRPTYETIKVELLLIKEKLNQGEALRKKMQDLGLSQNEREILRAVYADAANLISRVLTRMEVMACELLSTGKITINENNVNAEIDFKIPESHKTAFSGWSDPDHDIIGDLVAYKIAAKNKIKRALIGEENFGYMLKNNKIGAIAASAVPAQPMTQEFVTNYLKTILGMEFIVTSGTYKQSANSEDVFTFFKKDTITFLTTDGIVGNTFVTDPPEVDYGIANRTEGYVAVTQYLDKDPAGLWTKASAIALPCPKDIKTIYLATVTA